MRRTDFYRLTRPIQERFVAAAHGKGSPAPFLVSPAPRNWPLAPLLGIAVGLVGSAWVVGRGFGRLDSAHATAGGQHVGLYAVLLAVVMVSWLRLVRAARLARELPYRPGLYLFPIGLIDARRSRIDLYPWSELEHSSLSGDSRRIALVFEQGRVFRLGLTDPAQAAHVQAAVSRARERRSHAEGPPSQRDLGLLDPLTDNGIPNPLLPDTPLARKEAWWSRGWWWVGPMLGVGLGSALWTARNHLAQHALRKAARAANTAAAYRAYLAAAGPDEEVRSVFLPRAELGEAERTGSVRAVESVVARYPDAGRRPEFDMALRRVLLGELTRVRATNSADALRRFRFEQPHRALVATEADAALHDMYAAGLSQLEKDVSPRNPDLVTWFGRLLRHAELHGPRVEVRFGRKLDRSVAAADQRVMSSPYARGEASLPSRYFDDAHAAERERQTVDKFRRRFAQTFTGGLLSIELGAPLDGDSSDREPRVPTLSVEHTTVMNGTYANPDPPCVLVGVGILFRTVLRIPGSGGPVAFKFSVWHAPDRTQRTELDAERYYSELGEQAFAQFSARYLGSVFAAP
jgi:hypothetical protein